MDRPWVRRDAAELGAHALANDTVVDGCFGKTRTRARGGARHAVREIAASHSGSVARFMGCAHDFVAHDRSAPRAAARSEEHTSELQSLRHLVCRLLLEK